MSKKIFISDFPDENLQKNMISELSDMQTEKKQSLMSLMDTLSDGISSARELGNSWEKIAKYISEKIGSEVTADAVRHSYTKFTRNKRNTRRPKGELSYDSLKYRYKIAVKILEENGISESKIDLCIKEERMKNKKYRKNKKQDSESNLSEEGKLSNFDFKDFNAIEIENIAGRPREDKEEL